MAEKSGFFNALEVGGEYDRTYNADDYCNNLGAIISNGVRRSGADDLKITANGLEISMAVGRAWIEGHYYLNDTAKAIATITPPTGTLSRMDAVFIRLDKSTAVREVKAVYRQGLASAAPTALAPVRSDTIYELKLADILVKANASNVTIYDTRGDKTVCGWVTSPVGYDDYFNSLDGQFDTWFDAMKGQLSEDAAGHLQNQITTLASYIANMQNTELYSWNRYADDQDSTQSEITLSSSVLGFNELEIHTGGYNDNSSCNVLVLTVPQTLAELQEMTVKATYNWLFINGHMIEHVGEADYIFSAENKMKLSAAPVYAIYTENADVSGGKVKIMSDTYEGGPAYYELRIKKIIGRGNRKAPIIPTLPQYSEIQTNAITDEVREEEI
jgi:hypothetical protein